MEIDSDEEMKAFETKIEILKIYGNTLMMTISEALSFHCNPVLLKKYLSVMSDLANKLLRLEYRHEIILLLQYFMSFFQRLMATCNTVSTGRPFPLEVLRISRDIDFGSGYHGDISSKE